jgi:uncharacterized membrane protein YdjX (TVP38/TMEM64 family)
MTGILALISGYLFGWVVGGIVAALAAVFFGGLWLGVGLMRRRARPRPSNRRKADLAR